MGGAEQDGKARSPGCPDCRVCSPSWVDRVFLLSLTWLMTLLVLCSAEPQATRCPICGHPLRCHKRWRAI